MAVPTQNHVARDLSNFFSNRGHIHPCDLNNKIHSIFRPDNFPGVRYRLLEPSLKLASKFLDEPCLMHWWHALFFGRREQFCNDSKGGSDENSCASRLWRGPYVRYYRKEGTLSARDLAKTKLRLLVLGNLIRFLPSDAAKSGHWGDGTTPARHSGGFKYFDTTNFQGVTSEITYDRHYVHVFAHESKHDRATVLITRFKFAITLLHELCHAAQNAVHGYSGGQIEQFFEGESVAEAGCAWENFIFGGSISWMWADDAASEDHGRQALVCTPWPNAHDFYYDDNGPYEKSASLEVPEPIAVCWKVDVNVIGKFFTAAFWADVGSTAAFKLRKRRGLRWSFPTSAIVGYSKDRHGIPRGCELSDDGIVYAADTAFM